MKSVFIALLRPNFRKYSKPDATRWPFWKVVANGSKYRTQINRTEIAASLHLRQKLNWKAQQKKSHQKSHV